MHPGLTRQFGRATDSTNENLGHMPLFDLRCVCVLCTISGSQLFCMPLEFQYDAQLTHKN